MAKRTPKSAKKTTPRKPPTAAVRKRRAPVPAGRGDVYQLKITLDSIQPPIWRRVQVKDCSLAELHDLIQIVMGWQDCHLHDFQVGDERYGNEEQWGDDPWGEHDIADEAQVKLSQLVGRGVKKIRYEYDMGDSWRHTIQIEKPRLAEAGVHYPRCVDGARACPPEDCGGPWGYGDFLDAVQNPKNPQHADMRDWIGGDFDPEAFDLEAVNRRLT